MKNESALPFLLGGLLLAALLIFFSFGGNTPNDAVLQQRFAPQPTVPGEQPPEVELPKVTLPELPPAAREQVVKISEALSINAKAPALTPVAAAGGITVTVNEVERQGDQVSVRGSVRNDTTADLQIGPEAFIFRDSAGVTYNTRGSGTSTLAPGQETSFDLTVPLPPERGLTMKLDLPPNPPIEQMLVAEVEGQ